MGWGLPGSSVHGIFQARIVKWVAIPFSRGSSWTRDQTQVCIVGRLCHLSHFSSVQFSRSVVSHSAIPWTAARQASLSITNSWSSPKPMSTESVMPPSHLILCRPLLFLPSIFPSIRVFSNESALRIRWPKYQDFSFNISPSNKPLLLLIPLYPVYIIYLYISVYI